MKTFILVHGAYHGAWCWEKTIEVLKVNGHLGIAVELPNEISTKKSVELKDYVNSVISVVNNHESKVYLVGHSLGGQVISCVGEEIPQKIEKLIYLTGLLLGNGKRASEIPRNQLETPDYPRKQTDTNNKWYLNENIEDKNKLINYFYNKCLREDAEAALSKLRPQPLLPVETPAFLTEKNFGHLNKVYIECLFDNVIFPSVQKRMYSNIKCNSVYSIEACHSAFLSNPEGLVRILCKV